MIGYLYQSTHHLGYGLMSTETTPLSGTPRTTLRRHRERGQADRAALYEVLDAGLICHFGGQPTAKEMAATAVLSLPLAEASVKVRTGMSADEPEDHDLDVWAGVLPISVTFGEPLPDPRLRAEIPLPAHIRDRAS
jgi:hypothetical protein